MPSLPGSTACLVEHGQDAHPHIAALPAIFGVSVDLASDPEADKYVKLRRCMCVLYLRARRGHRHA